MIFQCHTNIFIQNYKEFGLEQTFNFSLANMYDAIDFFLALWLILI